MYKTGRNAYLVKVSLLLLSVIFLFTGVFAAPTVNQFFTCRDVVEGQPIGKTGTFKPTDDQVAVFLELKALDEEMVIHWKWLAPNGTLYYNRFQRIPSPAEKGYDLWEKYICWGFLYLHDIPSDLKDGLWTVRAETQTGLLGSADFSFQGSEPSQRNRMLENHIENVYFNYPRNWHFYDDEIDEGFCQAYHISETGHFLSFSVYLTDTDLLNSPQLREQTIKREYSALKGYNTEYALLKLFDDTEEIWYSSEIYHLSNLLSSTGKKIYLVSYAPFEIYDQYKDVFTTVFNSIRIEP